MMVRKREPVLYPGRLIAEIQMPNKIGGEIEIKGMACAVFLDDDQRRELAGKRILVGIGGLQFLPTEGDT